MAAFFSGDRLSDDPDRSAQAVPEHHDDATLFADMTDEERRNYLANIEREETEVLMVTAAGLAITAIAGAYVRQKFKGKEK